MKSKNPWIQENVLLAPMSSWLVGGPARFYALPENLEQLQEIWQWGVQNVGIPEITILSGGTNVLVSDSGVSGLVIHLKKLARITARLVNETGASSERLVIEALAGTAKSELLRTFLKYKLEPAVFLAGIPGDVGGGVVMNAGVGESIIPREFVEIVDWVDVFREGKVVRLQKSELQWSYRHCEGWGPGVIVNVGISWPNTPHPDVLRIVKEANQRRLKSQPLELPSCGSVFRNPPGGKSGQLIESCGLKGFQMGGAQVSTKHANFIVNTGGATASEIDQVIKHVQSTVRAKKNVELQTEVVYLGKW